MIKQKFLQVKFIHQASWLNHCLQLIFGEKWQPDRLEDVVAVSGGVGLDPRHHCVEDVKLIKFIIQQTLEKNSINAIVF